MQVSRENVSGNKVKLTITTEMGEWNELLDMAAASLGKTGKIEGFREGKAPRSVVINKVGEARVLSAASELAIEKFYPQAVRDEKLRPINFPSVSVDQVGLDTPVVFSAEVAVMPEVTLGDYTKIRVKREVPEVSEQMVTDTLESMRKKMAEYTEVAREAKEGDWTEIDFTGFVDDKEFPGGASKNHPIVIGEKMFIPGFEEGLVGMKAGEEKEIEVTFPTEYHATELAGKPAKFKVKLHKVKEMNLPELDDTFAKKASKFESLDELKADIRKFMEEDANRRADEQVKEEAIKELVKVVKLEVPEELVEQELTAMLNDLKGKVANAQMTFEDYLGKAGTNEAGLKSQWREQAVDRVKAGLALDALATKEDIQVTHDEVHVELDKLKAQYPDQAEEIEKHYGGHNHGHLESQMRTRKVVDRLIEIAGQ